MDSNGKGLVIVNTGNGKGKTTAALGLAMRAVGQGLKVVVVQFIKGTWQYGELEAAKMLGFDILPMGGGFTWETNDPELDRKMAEKGFEKSEELALSGEYDMLIMDEINNAVCYGHLGVERLLGLIKQKPATLHMVLTGRDANDKVIEVADLVTEMREVKHPFSKGIKAQPGIEY